MGRIRVADGSERSNAPSLRGRGYVGAAVGIGRGARSGWVGAGQRALSSWTGVRGISSGNREGCAQQMGRIGVADGSERDNAPSLRGREHLYSAR